MQGEREGKEWEETFTEIFLLTCSQSRSHVNEFWAKVNDASRVKIDYFAF